MCRRLLLGCVLLCAAVLAAPAAASAVPATTAADAEQQMHNAINAARAEHGLRALRSRGGLVRSSRTYARQMIARNRWGHASSPRVKGFGPVAEILGQARPGTDPGAVVRAWLASPVHRRIILGSRYSNAGVGTAAGRLGGKRTQVWVVRFAR